MSNNGKNKKRLAFEQRIRDLVRSLDNSELAVSRLRRTNRDAAERHRITRVHCDDTIRALWQYENMNMFRLLRFVFRRRCPSDILLAKWKENEQETSS